MPEDTFSHAVVYLYITLYWQEEEDGDLYSCLQDLRDTKDDLSQRVAELELCGDNAGAQQFMHQMQETEERIIQKNEERRQRKYVYCSHPNEPRHEKTCLRGFRPGMTQTGLRSHRS